MAQPQNQVALGAALLMVMEEGNNEEEEILMMLARIAAYELMEMEEGIEFGALDGPAWVPVTVFINEYHEFGDPCFKTHFRMTRTVFERLTETVHNHLTQKGRLKRERTPFQDIMLMVVWILATPDTFRSVALRFGVHPTTLHYFYTYVIEALRELSAVFIAWPDQDERVRIKTSFQRATGFPGAIGCIDGTHIQITAPIHNPGPFINRHHQYSINVQAVVDNNLLVRHVHVGEPGSLHDSRVFRRSSLHTDLLNRRGDDGIINHDEYLVGDGGYVLTDFMMIPFKNDGRLNDSQKNFNKRLSQTRVRVENAFARAKGKWRRLKFLHARNQAYVVDYITAAFVLHNFIILNGEPMLEEEELMRPIQNNEILGNNNIDDPDDLDDPDALDPGNPPLNEAEQLAKLRGHETRIFIMDNMLPPIGE